MGYNITIPQDFEGLNQYNSMRSVCGMVVNDENTAYYMRALYQRLISGARFKLPKRWAQGERYFKNVLFSEGYIGIIDHPDYGIIPQICTCNGYGIFLQPVNMLVSQPLVRFEGKIGENCELIHLTGDWHGVWDIVEHYAIRLSVAITSVDVSLFTTRASIMAAGKNKSAVETLKYLFKKISAGEPFVAYDKELHDVNEISGDTEPIWMQAFNVKDNYVTKDLLADIETILHQFDAEVGILSGTSKKERMIDAEVQSNNDDTCARATTWFNNLSDSFDRVNALFPDLDLSFSLKFGGEERVYNAANDVDRDV